MGVIPMGVIPMGVIPMGVIPMGDAHRYEILPFQGVSSLLRFYRCMHISNLRKAPIISQLISIFEKTLQNGIC